MRVTGERRRSVVKYVALTVAMATSAGLTTENKAFGQQANRPLRSEPSNAERYTNPPAETPLRRPSPVRVNVPLQQAEAPAVAPFQLTAVTVKGASAVAADKISST